MVIAVYFSEVNKVDERGSRHAILNVQTYASLAGTPDISLAVDHFQIAHPSIRGLGIPVTKLQLYRQSYGANPPFELLIDSTGGFNNDAPCSDRDGWHEQPDYNDIRNRYRDMSGALERSLVEAGFTVKELPHRLEGSFPCYRSEFTPKGKADDWSVARIVRLLVDEGFLSRDIGCKALKTVPLELAKLAPTGDLADAYRLVAQARGVTVDQVMGALDAISIPSVAPAAELTPR